MATIQARACDGVGAMWALFVLSMSAGVAAAADGPKVSFDRQVRPIFQAQCQGCHQPAKAGGGYVMTAFDRLLKGGDSGEHGDRPGQARRELPHRQDHPGRRQGRDAPGQAAALGRRDRADQPLDRPGGRRRHADERPGEVRPGPSARSTPARRSSRRSTFSPDGSAPGRRRVPRGPALEGRRLRAGRAARRPLGADRVARRSRPTGSSWPSPAAAPAGWARSRSGTSPRGSSSCRSPSPSTPSTARAGRPTARRSPSAAPTTPCGRSTPRPASRCCSWGRTATGRSTRSSRSTAITSSRSAAT